MFGPEARRSGGVDDFQFDVDELVAAFDGVGLREVREGGLRPDRRLEALQEAHLRAGSSEGAETVASS